MSPQPPAAQLQSSHKAWGESILEDSNIVYEFGNFRLEPGQHRLLRDGIPVPLRAKVFQTLRLLVQRHGDLLTKNELINAVWPETNVEENNLDHNISMLRKALKDRASNSQFIETVPRIGYRFVAAVTEIPAALAAAAAANSGIAVPAPAGSQPHSSAGPDVVTIAVLPFADMSPTRDQDYLCEGLAEELINALTSIDGLCVAARTSSFRFRGGGADVRAVGQQLGVTMLLEGSVRKSDDRLRITVQLIETDTGYHRWSQRFDRTLDDIFAIQDEISENVATSISGGVLSLREKQGLRRPPTAALAYEYYLRGRQLLHLLTQAALSQSREMFERAIDVDPRYAPAWAGLAMAHATLYEWFGADDEDLRRADRAGRNAMDLAPGLADSHVARGCTLAISRHYGRAERRFSEAARINPNLFEAYYYWGRTCFACGEIERSAELFSKAASTRKEDFQSALLLAQSLRMIGRAESSRKATREGIARAERVLAINPNDSRALSMGATALVDDGQKERALEWSNRALELDPDDVSSLINAACLHAKLGLKEEVISLLERTFAKGLSKRDWFKNDPVYDGMRDDPRFKKLLERLK